MGAGNVLPTVPTFVSGAPTITDMNNLAYAARFLVDHGTRPTWKFIMWNVTPSITANTWTAVPFNTSIYDSDGVWTSGINGATIVTQGWYRVEAALQPKNTGSKINHVSAFKWIAGANSPYSASSPGWFGFKATALPVTGSGTVTAGATLGAVTPFAMYPGDTLQVMTFISATTTLESNSNVSYIEGRFSCQFTGRWLRTGT